MENLEQNIRQLVEEVVRSMNLNLPKHDESKSTGVFSNIGDAIAAGEKAYLALTSLSLETRKKIIESIRRISLANNEKLSKMAQEETGLGRWEDKILKNELGIMKTPGVEDIQPEAYSDDAGMTLVEKAPYGVIGSITPSTNPVVTIISNSIGMIAAGNAVVFNPHPSAKKSFSIPC